MFEEQIRRMIDWGWEERYDTSLHKPGRRFHTMLMKYENSISLKHCLLFITHFPQEQIQNIRRRIDWGSSQYVPHILPKKLFRAMICGLFGCHKARSRFLYSTHLIWKPMRSCFMKVKTLLEMNCSLILIPRARDRNRLDLHWLKHKHCPKK